MKKYFLTLLLFLVCFISIIANAFSDDDIRVRSEVDKAFLTIGEHINYTVTIEHSPDIKILSAISAPDSDILEIKKVEDINKKQKKRIIEGKKFVLTTFRLGEFVLPPVKIEYQKKDEQKKSIQSQKIYLTVKSVAGTSPQNDIRDIKSVVPFEWKISKYLWMPVAFLTIFLIVLAYKRIRENRFDESPKSKQTSEEIALQELEKLFHSGLIESGKTKLYYLKLSEIIRVYFESRYKILAVEATTAEILRSIKSLSLSSALYQKIQHVLESADLAKFAKWIPTAAETNAINKNSEEIIKESASEPDDNRAEEGQEGI